MRSTPHPPHRSRLPLRLLAALLPIAEREEVVDDVAAEHAARWAAGGRRRADAWLWRQVLSSLPALLRRSWWRGWSGFEPEANRFRTGGPMLESWIMDGRFAVRRLVRRPAYTALAVLTLALGVGGTAALYGIARTLLLSELPVRAEQDVAVWWHERDWNEQEFLYLRGEGVRGFEGFAAYGPEDVRLGGAGAVTVTPAVRTSAELFEVLGVRPALGPGFQAGDDAQGAERKVVLSHGLWQELGGSRDVVGTRVEVNGEPHTVAGVMPRGFWFPDPSARLWYAHPFDPEVRNGWYVIVGRLEPGLLATGAEGVLAGLRQMLADRFEYAPQWDKTAAPALTPLRDRVLAPIRPTLLAALSAMAVILLIACANVAALMLGQMEMRTTELSVRNALGAGRRRLTQQLVIEGVMLGVAAGAAGAVLAAVSFSVLRAALPLGALAERATLDWAVFWIALAIAVAAALVIALVSVLVLLRAELRGALVAARTGGIAGRGGRLESGLVVAEVALAVVIATGAGLLIRSVDNLRAIETGLNARDVAIVDVVAPAEVSNDERRRMLHDVLEELRTLPGVRTVALTQKLPLRGTGHNWGIALEDEPERELSTTAYRVVSRDYFTALGMRLQRGRVFDATDVPDAEPSVVINEALAALYFPGRDPIGRRIGSGFGTWSRIVGIVADAQEAALTDGAVPARYMLLDQVPFAFPPQTLVLRAAPGLDLAQLLESARTTIRRAAPGMGVQDATTMARVVDRALGPARQLMTLVTLLAALALLLGGIGVYGVISHFVGRRRRDWGIRMALGLRPLEVVGQIVGRSALLVAAGIVVGIGAAFFLMRVLAGFVYGIGTTDPLALLAASLTLLGVGVGGALLPARRAARVDPARVLREQ